MAAEEEGDKLWQLDCNSATEEEEDNFALLGGRLFCCGFEMKFVGREAIPWIVDLGAMNPLVSKLRWKLD